jgi:hypothetical protein
MSMTRRSGAERQRKHAEKQKAGGRKQVYLWLRDGDAAALKAAYPGTRGGIDWRRIIERALSPSNTESTTPVPVTSPTNAEARTVPAPPKPEPSPTNEIIPYWKPDPSKPRDPRCQARNRDGYRCKSQGEILLRVRDAKGRIGEFNACKLHDKQHRRGSEFIPHRSVLDLLP